MRTAVSASMGVFLFMSLFVRSTYVSAKRTFTSTCRAEMTMEGTGGYGVQVLKRYSLAKGTLCVDGGSVTDFVGDAIINAANVAGLSGGGVDGRITSLGGKDLASARAALPVQQFTASEKGRVPTGGAVMVGPAPGGRYGKLFVPYVILAVGPNYNVVTDPDEGDRLLAGAYSASVTLAKEGNLSKVGFPLISAGVYRGRRPLSDVLRIAVEAIRSSSYDGADIHLVAYSKEEQDQIIEVADELLVYTGFGMGRVETRSSNEDR